MMANVSSSNGQKANIPKLRFPGIEGEWMVFKAEDLFKNVVPYQARNYKITG